MPRLAWLRTVLIVALVLLCGTVARNVLWAEDRPAARPAERLSIDDMVDLEATFTRIVERVGPSVVAIRVTRPLRSTIGGDESAEIINQGLDQPVESAGSGVVVRGDGMILTNEHVIMEAESIRVRLSDGREFEASVVGRDARSDLAVIRIPAQGLRPAELGDLRTVRRGQWAIAMGNPFGLARDGQASVSIGHVSATGRALQRELDPTQQRYYGNLIQTTADINPGNSGGPLLNLNGQVIGINTAIQTRGGGNEGVGFAVPVSERTRAIIDALLVGRQVEYGYLGVQTRRPLLTERRRAGVESGGAYVTSVDPGAPAEHAGIRTGDILTAFNGVAIEDDDHLIRLVGAARVGAFAEVRLVRDGRTMDVRVRVGRRRLPGEPASARLRAGGAINSAS